MNEVIFLYINAAISHNGVSVQGDYSLALEKSRLQSCFKGIVLATGFETDETYYCISLLFSMKYRIMETIYCMV